MKIVGLETWTVSVPYVHDEISSRVARSGVTDTIVRLTADNGLTGLLHPVEGVEVTSLPLVKTFAKAVGVGRVVELRVHGAFPACGQYCTAVGMRREEGSRSSSLVPNFRHGSHFSCPV